MFVLMFYRFDCDCFFGKMQTVQTNFFLENLFKGTLNCLMYNKWKIILVKQ